MRDELYVRMVSTDAHCGQATWCLDFFIVPGYHSAILFRSGVLLSYFLDTICLLILVGGHVAINLKLLPLLAWPLEDSVNISANSCCIPPHGSHDGKAHLMFCHPCLWRWKTTPACSLLALYLVSSLEWEHKEEYYSDRPGLRTKHLRFPSDNRLLKKKFSPNQTSMSMVLYGGQKETSVLPCGTGVFRLRRGD